MLLHSDPRCVICQRFSGANRQWFIKQRTGRTHSTSYLSWHYVGVIRAMKRNVCGVGAHPPEEDLPGRGGQSNYGELCFYSNNNKYDTHRNERLKKDKTGGPPLDEKKNNNKFPPSQRTGSGTVERGRPCSSSTHAGGDSP
uniref:Uncharacterized protein n=1 Tax=Daphnia galeata TaxID=27404 RepID=A0A8J2RTS5_9CRUS|nr:unnamed protein product [Daphnia galeata]